MAAEAHRERSLYRLRFVLPEGWLDLTDYAFSSQSALTQLTFADEPIASADVEAWLNEMRARLVDALGAKVGPIRTFENPRFPARGFEARFGEGAAAPAMTCVAMAHGRNTLTVRAKGSEDYVVSVEAAVRSLMPAPAVILPPLHPVYDLAFTCPVPLEDPSTFAYASEDQKSRLTSRRVAEHPQFGEREWSEAFVFPLDAMVTVVTRDTQIASGKPPDAPPFFQTFEVAALAEVLPGMRDDGSPTPGVREELFLGQARADLGGEFQFFEFTSQLGFTAAREIFRSILSSMQRER
jgi:hypothetical protein